MSTADKEPQQDKLHFCLRLKQKLAFYHTNKGGSNGKLPSLPSHCKHHALLAMATKVLTLRSLAARRACRLSDCFVFFFLELQQTNNCWLLLGEHTQNGLDDNNTKSFPRQEQAPAAILTQVMGIMAVIASTVGSNSKRQPLKTSLTPKCTAIIWISAYKHQFPQKHLTTKRFGLCL